MSRLPVTIPKQPTLNPAEDYYLLRRVGIGFIEQMGSQFWTDYNTHDPGITILEALCYALTDIAYRTGWEMPDILAPAQPAPDKTQPFPQQAFFTAREILTVNPVTPDDFRRLLIDLEGVRNAWVFCKECACEVPYYGWCENDQLQLSYQPPDPKLQPQKVEPQGLYETLLELEADPELGDLNDRKIVQTFSLEIADKLHPYTLELRFPAWELLNQATYEAFTQSKDNPLSITRGKFSRSKTDNNVISDAELRRNWRNVFYLSFSFSAGGKAIQINNAALRIFSAAATAQQLTVKGVTQQLTQGATTGFLPQYRRKLQTIAAQVEAAQTVLNSHRNLDEDYCRVKAVEAEDVAVCADVEVKPDADIERVQAEIWFAIEQYFNPPVRFYTLQELLEDKVPVEEIFNGPELSNGFLKAAELEAAGLKTVLRTSDIINRLMDIPGVVAVNNLLLTKYDAEGNVIKGKADPDWDAQGQPIFDANKVSAAWLLYISQLHQPRLYHNLSRFLFYKNALPFLPRMDEAYDTLTQLRGEAERPKIPTAPKDLPVPAGTFRHPEEYYPVQYSFPLTYGIGPDGLPSHVSTQRRAQARQLKAYLLVFEQLLGNALAQVAHTADLFSLDPSINRTYFFREFKDTVIQGYDDLTNGLTPTALAALTETQPEFHERRNRFLNHLMARFGEQFGEYALLLTNFQGQAVAQSRLIKDKISFLKAYPKISHDRGKAFDHKTNPCAPENISGLKKRVSLLLGYPDLAFQWTVTGTSPGPYTITQFHLADKNGTIWLAGNLSITASTEVTAKQKAFRTILIQMIQPGAYEIAPDGAKFRLKLKDKTNNPLGEHPTLFQTKSDAQSFEEELVGWSSNERALVVEHLLLRPKFLGDALFPACTDGPCVTCGDEDPYSFRLTFVMPGWTAPYNVNMEMRRFADRTIRQETPSHLLGKICWVGNDGFLENPCDPVICDLVELLIAKGLTSSGVKPTEKDACACAAVIYTAFSAAFKNWYENKTLDYFQPDALQKALEAEFTAQVTPAALSCTTDLVPLWPEIQALMVQHFQHIALYGWQFERFEDAWCQWLEVNAKFDWAEERLQERVEAILTHNLVTALAAVTDPEGELCQCAATILTKFGVQFYHWMDTNFRAGRAYPDFTVFTPDSVTLCPGFKFNPATEKAIETLLKGRYEAYKEVSYRLWVVVNLLSQLRNTYPGATLHDCDDGSDQNPVRLGTTALGNYPLRQAESPTAAPEPSLSSASSAEQPAPSKSAKQPQPKPMKSSKPEQPGKARKPKAPS